MATPANRASGSGDTNKPKKKPPAKRPAKTDPNAPPLYSWNGGPKTHTVSQADHAMHVADPLTKDPLYASAKQQATSYYAPQVNALNTLQTSAPVWYQNYINQATGAQAAAAKYAAPMIQQAQDFATNVNTPAAGLDPNSPEYQRSQQAGKGLSALATLGAQNLQGNQQATTDYFGGQQANAAAALPGALAQYQQQQGQLGSQVAGKTQELYQGLKQAAVNEDIARQTLGVNAARAGGYDPITGAKLPADPSDQKTSADLAFFKKHGYYPATGPKKTPTGYGAGAPGMNKYGYTYDEWTGMSPKAQANARAGTGAKGAAKKTASIKTAAGKVQNQFTDINDYGGGLVGKLTDDTTKPKDPKTGQYPARKITKADADAAVRTKYGMKGRIALAIRDGRPLDEKAQAYLHGLDPNFRIPREWIAGRRTTTSRPGNAPAGNGQSRPT